MTFMSYYIHVQTCDRAVKIRPHHFLTVASHHTLARSEIFRCEYGWCDNEWHVRSVDVAGLEVAAALVADKDLVSDEIGVLVDGKAVAESTDCFCADGEWRANLSFAVHGELGLIEHRGLEDGCDVWAANHEVCRATERLAMDGVGNVDDCLD